MPQFLDTKTLGELAQIAQAKLKGNPECIITGVSTLASAKATEISFLTNPVYRTQLSQTAAGAVILTEEDAKNYHGNVLITAEPHAAYAKVAALCVPFQQLTETMISSQAVISKTARIGKNVWIGPGAVIGEEAVIGDYCVLKAQVVVGDRVSIGQNCYLHPGVVLYPDVIIGDRVEIHAHTVVGSDGFGFAIDKGRWIKVPQLGRVRIGNDVEIGAHTTIDRGAIEDTVIEEGVKIDNQVQIAHNVVIGAHTVIAGCAAFAGSSKIGRYCLIGGGATFAGHITVCDNVHIAGMTTVTRSITKPGVYASGTGMMPASEWRRTVVHFRHLDEYVDRLKKLEKSRS